MSCGLSLLLRSNIEPWVKARRSGRWSSVVGILKINNETPCLFWCCFPLTLHISFVVGNPMCFCCSQCEKSLKLARNVSCFMFHAHLQDEGNTGRFPGQVSQQASTTPAPLSAERHWNTNETFKLNFPGQTNNLEGSVM